MLLVRLSLSSLNISIRARGDPFLMAQSLTASSLWFGSSSGELILFAVVLLLTGTLLELGPIFRLARWWSVRKQWNIDRAADAADDAEEEAEAAAAAAAAEADAAAKENNNTGAVYVITDELILTDSDSEEAGTSSSSAATQLAPAAAPPSDSSKAIELMQINARGHAVSESALDAGTKRSQRSVPLQPLVQASPLPRRAAARPTLLSPPAPATGASASIFASAAQVLPNHSGAGPSSPPPAAATLRDDAAESSLELRVEEVQFDDAFERELADALDAPSPTESP
jgi:hypothetical protein